MDDRNYQYSMIPMTSTISSDSSMDDRNKYNLLPSPSSKIVQIPLWTIGTNIIHIIKTRAGPVQIPLWTIGTYRVMHRLANRFSVQIPLWTIGTE